MRLARIGDRPVLLVEDGIVDIARTGGGRFGTGLGPFSLFTERLDVMVEFNTTVLGLQPTEETTYDGYRIVYLRHGTEHHSIVLADRSDAVDTQPESYVGPAFLGPLG